MMISDLPVDLLEDILSRVLFKSIGAVRSTCKKWNVLSKDERFANKHIEKTAASQRDKEVLVITVNTKDHLISVKFYDFHDKNFDPSINRNGILSTREKSDQVVSVHHVFYCNGLLLCLCRGNNKRGLVVCNPYWGKRRWIKNPTERSYEMFAFGYDKSCRRTHKVLRLSSDDNIVIHIDIYDLSCDTWKTPDEAFHSSFIEYKKPGVSLKGNTYWLAKGRDSENCYLLCFDFTSERFGARLPLPFDFTYGCNVSLSCVKEEKLAVLFKPRGGGIFETIDVWVTDKIEPDAVSWSKLLKFETFKLNFRSLFGSFLIDEESKTFVIFDNCEESFETYIIDWESGHFRKAESIEASHSRLDNLVGCYVPSSVQI
ncbi:F-box protein [Raphanus sativus]|nr:F-box protein [Raphanus sativus]